MMSAILHSVSSAKIFHAVGITPEARTEEQALGHRKPLDVIELGKRELDEAIHSLDKDTVPEVSWVTIGCPHCSIGEIRDVARLLNGRKINRDVLLWVCTSKPVKALADRMGLTEVLEKAGGKMVTECCPALCTSQTVRNLGFQSLTTNSTEMAFVMLRVNCKDGIMQAAAPGDFPIERLFLNGRLQHLARYPNYDSDARLPFLGTARARVGHVAVSHSVALERPQRRER